jgi:hypothetical protein
MDAPNVRHKVIPIKNIVVKLGSQEDRCQYKPIQINKNLKEKWGNKMQFVIRGCRTFRECKKYLTDAPLGYWSRLDAPKG